MMTAEFREDCLVEAIFALSKCLAESRSASPAPGVFNMLNQVMKELRIMSDKFNTEMSAMRSDIAAQSTVIASATVAFNGLVAKLAAAEASAKAAGATDEQIEAVTAVRTSLEANTAALAQAIPQNTPAAEPADPAPTEPAAPATPVATPAEPVPDVPVPAEPSTPAA